MRNYSPRQQSSPAFVDTEVDREVEHIVRALDEAGPTTMHHLADLVAARRLGPGRFRKALREAVSRGRVVRLRWGVMGHGLYALPERGRENRSQDTREQTSNVKKETR